MRRTACGRQEGLLLIEALLAATLLAVGVLGLAEVFVVATRATRQSAQTSLASILAAQKLEELRALTWVTSPQGIATADATTDTAVLPHAPSGGTGLAPSLSADLSEDVAGNVDYLDGFGNRVGASDPPLEAVFVRRWAVVPWPADPTDTLVLHVRVIPHPAPPDRTGRVARRLGEVWLTTVRTRRAM